MGSGHSQDVRTAVASHDNSRLASGGNDRVPMVSANTSVHFGQTFKALCRSGMLAPGKLFVI
jgi:hypothetical protein